MRAAVLVVGIVLVAADIGATRQVPEQAVSRIQVIGIIKSVGLGMGCALGALVLKIEGIDGWVNRKWARESFNSAVAVEKSWIAPVVFMMELASEVRRVARGHGQAHARADDA